MAFLNRRRRQHILRTGLQSCGAPRSDAAAFAAITRNKPGKIAAKAEEQASADRAAPRLPAETGEGCHDRRSYFERPDAVPDARHRGEPRAALPVPLAARHVGLDAR